MRFRAWATRLGLAAAAACLAAPAAALPLRVAAAGAGIFVGAAANDFEIGTPVGDLLAREFASLTPENQMKWSALEPSRGVFDFGPADALVAFAESNGMRVRGHTLAWGTSNGPPGWLAGTLAAAPDPAALLRELMNAHVATVAGRWAGRIESWDVVNEPLATTSGAFDPSNLYTRYLGESYIGDAFRAARAADPSALLFLNETLVEANPAKFDALLALVDRLLAAGVPIDGVGLQGHFLTRPNRARLTAQLQAIADRGLAVEITELDLPLLIFSREADPLAAQAAAYADVFAACLAVARCRGITTWGISDADTWLDTQPLFEFFAPNRPLLFDESLARKPAHDAVVATLLAVPEPHTAAALALGLALLGRLRTHRRG